MRKLNFLFNKSDVTADFLCTFFTPEFYIFTLILFINSSTCVCRNEGERENNSKENQKNNQKISLIHHFFFLLFQLLESTTPRKTNNLTPGQEISVYASTIIQFQESARRKSIKNQLSLILSCCTCEIAIRRLVMDIVKR